MSDVERRIGVVGLGYVGGTIVRAFTDAGAEVAGYDRYLSIGRPSDLSGCGVVFLCVPTPPSAEGPHDLTEVGSAMETIGPHLDAGAIVALKSTVVPGTCEQMAAAHPHLRFASVPEFLVQDRPMETFTHPDRVIIGTGSDEVERTLAGLMALVAPEAPVIRMRPSEAEITKLCANAMLAAKVGMANQLADVCAAYGVEWSEIQDVIGMDHRIGPDHLTVTEERGFGGACLPKDLDGLIGSARSAGIDPALLEALAEYNRAIRSDAARLKEAPDRA